MMSTMKHTPGPWHTHESRADEIWASRRPIAMTVARAGDDRGEEEANTRLIATAPDLLKACRNALRVIGYVVEVHDFSFEATMQQLKTAIAKAEGKE
ncbi:MAG: hypothetical protein GY832_24285 [Chloroflexi bacterium]|nr:hypothetical protein [Chloroflexota bacterium]